MRGPWKRKNTWYRKFKLRPSWGWVLWKGCCPLVMKREEVGDDAGDVARVLGISVKELTDIEEGRGELKGRHALALSEVWGTPVWLILEKYYQWRDLEPADINARVSRSTGAVVGAVPDQVSTPGTWVVPARARATLGLGTTNPGTDREGGQRPPSWYYAHSAGSCLPMWAHNPANRTPYVASGQADRGERERLSGEDEVLVRRLPINDDCPMPFGKYRGQPIGDVRPDYLLMLCTQPWLRNGWPSVYSYLQRKREQLESDMEERRQRTLRENSWRK